MKINDSLIDKLSALAKLEFEGAEKEQIKSDLEKMLGFVESLQHIPTDNTDPLIYLTDEKGMVRKDENINTLSKSDALKNAPQKDSFYFKVPKVLNK